MGNNLISDREIGGEMHDTVIVNYIYAVSPYNLYPSGDAAFVEFSHNLEDCLFFIWYINQMNLKY